MGRAGRRYTCRSPGGRRPRLQTAFYLLWREKSYSHPRATRSSRPRSTHLRTTKRREVAERIKEAREFGDISENAEYDHAKNEQAMLEARIAQLEDKLRNATVIDQKQIDAGVVSVGTRVRVKDQKSGQSVALPDRRLGGGRSVREQALERVARGQRPDRPQARRRGHGAGPPRPLAQAEDHEDRSRVSAPPGTAGGRFHLRHGSGEALSRVHNWCAAALICGAALACSSSPAAGETYGSLVTPTGAEQIVFNGPGACPVPPGASGHHADAPLRAFRDARQRVQMTMAQGNANRRLIGPSLNSLSPDCQVVHPLQPQGGSTPPSSYANYAWLISPYRQPNGKVYALVHNEYYGILTNPPDCSSTAWENCWMVSITSALSTDDGESYPNTAPPPGHLVAALPYPYERDWGRQGYQNPTNIVANPADGYYYALINVISIPNSAPGTFRAQEVGNCVIRSPGLDPPSWRAWNGTAFSTEFINPYAPGYDPVADPPNHVCKPVSTSQGKLRRSFTSHSLMYSTFFNKFLVMGQQTRDGVTGFWYSLSDDLLDWSAPRLVRTNVPLGDCTTAERRASYPSFLDAADTSTNFERPGRDVYLYYVKLNWCGPTPNDDRDVARVPVRLERPLRWATGVAEGCRGGFDSQVAASGTVRARLQPQLHRGAGVASLRRDGRGRRRVRGLQPRGISGGLRGEPHLPADVQILRGQRRLVQRRAAASRQRLLEPLAWERHADAPRQRPGGRRRGRHRLRRLGQPAAFHDRSERRAGRPGGDPEERSGERRAAAPGRLLALRRGPSEARRCGRGERAVAGRRQTDHGHGCRQLPRRSLRPPRGGHRGHRCGKLGAADRIHGLGRLRIRRPALARSPAAVSAPARPAAARVRRLRRAPGAGRLEGTPPGPSRAERTARLAGTLPGPWAPPINSPPRRAARLP